MAKKVTKKAAKKVTKKAAKKPAKRIVRLAYTKDDVRKLKAYSKARTPLTIISKEMKRTKGSLRQKAIRLGIGLGHQR
jgi:hypothetical protein